MAGCDMYQDVNQQQVFGVGTLSIKPVLHAEFCGIRYESTAVPVQPVVYLQNKEHAMIIIDLEVTN